MLFKWEDKNVERILVGYILYNVMLSILRHIVILNSMLILLVS